MRLNAIAYTEKYLEIAFTPLSLRWNWQIRNKYFIQLFYKYNLKEYIDVLEPELAKEEELQLVHSRKYIGYVKMKSIDGEGYLDYGDTPAYKGVFEDALLAVGGTVKLVKLLMKRVYQASFNPQGGFHHAQKNSAAGFCVFNDVALAATLAYNHGLKVAVIDVDGHHGDGTQFILYNKPILKISFHRYGNFYPGTGYVNELGEGDGYGYSVNIPLPARSGDDVFVYVLDNLIVPLLEDYKPEIIIAQMGVDAHLGDPLVDLRLTSKSYRLFAMRLKEIADKYSNGRILGLGGGGYDPDSTSRMWIIMISEIFDIPNDIREKIYNDLKDKVEDTKSENQVFETVRERLKYLQSELRKTWNL
ncbi:MAG: acetoin utilization protein AcuC [Thermofilum sp. ex4484_82]|nr:MAG: acetoin utilization protein AcuC [Thermofilum sp. ex4484_82]OYT39569.1 MAG: acetoin utilization protein AcuC [Archaeoglobales archaeon ex4484_92]